MKRRSRPKANKAMKIIWTAWRGSWKGWRLLIAMCKGMFSPAGRKERIMVCVPSFAQNANTCSLTNSSISRTELTFTIEGHGSAINDEVGEFYGDAQRSLLLPSSALLHSKTWVWQLRLASWYPDVRKDRTFGLWTFQLRSMDPLRITPQCLFIGPPDQSTKMFTQSLIQEWSGRVFWYAPWRHYAKGLLYSIISFFLVKAFH